MKLLKERVKKRKGNDPVIKERELSSCPGPLPSYHYPWWSSYSVLWACRWWGTECRPWLDLKCADWTWHYCTCGHSYAQTRHSQISPCSLKFTLVNKLRVPPSVRPSLVTHHLGGNDVSLCFTFSSYQPLPRWLSAGAKRIFPLFFLTPLPLLHFHFYPLCSPLFFSLLALSFIICTPNPPCSPVIIVAHRGCGGRNWRLPTAFRLFYDIPQTHQLERQLPVQPRAC